MGNAIPIGLPPIEVKKFKLRVIEEGTNKSKAVTLADYTGKLNAEKIVNKALKGIIRIKVGRPKKRKKYKKRKVIVKGGSKVWTPKRKNKLLFYKSLGIGNIEVARKLGLSPRQVADKLYTESMRKKFKR